MKKHAPNLLCAVLACAPLSAHAETYLHDPRVDERTHDQKGPFNYFLTPSDALGFSDSPKAFQLTGDGAISSYWSEMTLWAGTPLKRLNSRVRTLDEGCLPILNYGSVVDGIEYRVKTFAVPTELESQGNLLAFCRITATNPGKKSQRVALGARVFDREGAWRHPLFDKVKPMWWYDRFIDQSKWQPWKLWEATEVREDNAVFRSEGNHLIQAYRPDASGWKVLTVKENVDPFEFILELEPGKSASVDFVMPFTPVSGERPAELKKVTAARFDDYLKRTTDYWHEKLNPATRFEVPEQKVMDMHKSSLMYDLMARDLAEDGKTRIQTVSDVQYNEFFSRDAAFIIHTYDMLGLPKVAEECIEHVLLKDSNGKLNGLRTTHPDAWGQALWTLAAHYRMTGDKSFVERVYPLVAPHIAKLEEETAKDPWGLWPVAGPYDNERINGHYTGHSFWVLRGLKDAVEMATVVGNKDEAARFQKVHDRYEEKFLKRLKDITDKTDGYIPPGLDDPFAGMDWENASGGVYPFGVISADNPMVANTVKTVRDFAYQEGIMTYEHNAYKVRKSKEGKGVDWSQPEHTVIHHYETFQVLETLLSLCMDREVVTDFYSFLVHTGSTNTGFEFDIWAWRDRNFHNNYPPHGWCAARFNECFRNMLVREDTHDPVLHLASALAPLWLQPGKQVKITNAPTDFGTISYTIDATEGGAKVILDPNWRSAPKSVQFHIPWFAELKSATVDGKEVKAVKRVIELPANARVLDLKWTLTPKPDLSYAKGVERYVDHYWKIQFGEKIPGFDSRWIFPDSE